MSSTSVPEPFVEFVQTRAGEYFRGLAVYDDHGAKLTHWREDLDEAAMAERVEELHWAIRPRSDFEAVDALGEPFASIQLREKAVVINFPIGRQSGYLVGLEPEAARNLHGFVTECISRLDRD